MLLSYYNDSHFDLLYDINANLDNLVKNLTILNIKKPINNNKDSIYIKEINLIITMY